MIDHRREAAAPGALPGAGYLSAVSISRQAGTVTVMPLETRLDGQTAPVFLDTMSRVFQQWPDADLVLDFSRVADMDNHGLTAIIQIFKTILGNSRDFTICELNARLQELFRITMLDQTLGAHYQPGQSLH